MAIMNMNQLFDKLQQYIDTKIDDLAVELEDLFIEYGLKEIKPFLDEIKIVADNIDTLAPIAENLPALVDIGENMDSVLAIPGQLVEMEDKVVEGNSYYKATIDEAEFGKRWSQNPISDPVTHPDYPDAELGFSSYHWSEVSRGEASALTLKGYWNPKSGAYPIPTEHGDYWVIKETAWYDDIYWTAGSRIAWYDDGTSSEWMFLQTYIDWVSVVGKPNTFPPSEHDHVEYVKKEWMLDHSDGFADAGLGVKLNSEGLVDNSMIKLPVVYLAGKFTPIHGSIESEYPDTSNSTYGATWYIELPLNERFTWQEGDLVGLTVKTGDYMAWTESGWIKVTSKLYPEDYYKRDGSYPMTGSITAGLNKMIDLGDATEDGDAVSLGVLNTRLTSVFDESEFIVASTGGDDMHKPIILNDNGLIDGSFVGFSSLVAMGGWNPEGVDGEYPVDPTPGQYWYVYDTNVDDEDGHTFIGGDLVDRYATDNDYMLYTQSGWFLKAKVNLDPNDFIRSDGTTAMIGNLRFTQGATVSGIVDPEGDSDAIPLSYFNDQMVQYRAKAVDIAPSDIAPQGAGSLLDADTIDGKHAIDFAVAVHTHNADEVIGQGHFADGSGFDADLLDGLHADAFRLEATAIEWDDLAGKPPTYTPPFAGETVVGGIRIWEDTTNGILYLSNTAAP